jgi:hypothetical protein
MVMENPVLAPISANQGWGVERWRWEILYRRWHALVKEGGGTGGGERIPVSALINANQG